jgi:hypothetical protein
VLAAPKRRPESPGNRELALSLRDTITSNQHYYLVRVARTLRDTNCERRWEELPTHSDVPSYVWPTLNRN